MASLFEIVLGVSGLIGLLLRYIGPLAIAPTITLVGLALFDAAASFASKNWYIALAYVSRTSSSAACLGSTTGAALPDNNEATAKSTSQDGGMAVNFG